MPELGFDSELDSALAALAQGDSAVAVAELERLDHRLASLPDPDAADPGRAARTRPNSAHLRRSHPSSRLLRRRRTRVKFVEIDLLGVYVAPISLLMVAAWFVTIACAANSEPFRVAALRLASGAVRVRRVHHRAVVYGAHHRPLSSSCPKLKPNRSVARPPMFAARALKSTSSAPLSHHREPPERGSELFRS